MITRYAYNCFEVDCDKKEECDNREALDSTGESFEDLIWSLKVDGWRIFKDENGKWKHICKFH